MQMFEILILTLATGLSLAILRFTFLAFLPAHPASQLMGRLDRLFGVTR